MKNIGIASGHIQRREETLPDVLFPRLLRDFLRNHSLGKEHPVVVLPFFAQFGSWFHVADALDQTVAVGCVENIPGIIETGKPGTVTHHIADGDPGIQIIILELQLR
ncbi:hypothetical protein D3C86_1648010 [compost metagenome]